MLDIKNELLIKKKDQMGTINVPTALFYNKPLPKEIVNIVDRRSLISNICSPYYLYLESLGVFVKDINCNKLISDFY